MLTARTIGGSGVEDPQDAYAYPNDLARFVRESWEDHKAGADGPGYEPTEVPETPILERLFSTCYQASLLREEERPVSFRAILAAPEDLPEGDGPPGGLHRLEFGKPRPFDERELRRLSPAADIERSLVGVRREEGGELEIWGNVATIALAVILAFFFGYSLTMLPLLRSGLALAAVLPLAFASDTLSITVMEIVDNLVMVLVPGAMMAGPTTLLFWGSLVFALLIAGAAAFPVNRYLISRGRGHAVVHQYYGGHD